VAGSRAREQALAPEGGDFFVQLAAHWKKNYAGWTAWVLTPDLKLPGKMRLKESRRVPMWNGPIECRLFRFDMVRGSARGDTRERRRIGRAAMAADAPVLVIDTNIVLDLLVFEDPAVVPLRDAVHQGRVVWLATAAMREECERVLGYAQIARRLVARQLPVQDLLAQFDHWSRAVPQPARATVRCGDPDDQIFVDLAWSRTRRICSARTRSCCVCASGWRPWGWWCRRCATTSGSNRRIPGLRSAPLQAACNWKLSARASGQDWR
jgi:predicted nucleic acid-binding protein